MDYYQQVADFHNRLNTLIKALTEAQKIISPDPKDKETFPGLLPTTPKDTQYELLTNAWIVLKQIDESVDFGSDMDEMFEALNEAGECPVKVEPFQGEAVGK